MGIVDKELCDLLIRLAKALGDRFVCVAYRSEYHMGLGAYIYNYIDPYNGSVRYRIMCNCVECKMKAFPKDKNYYTLPDDSDMLVTIMEKTQR